MIEWPLAWYGALFNCCEFEQFCVSAVAMLYVLTYSVISYIYYMNIWLYLERFLMHILVTDS